MLRKNLYETDLVQFEKLFPGAFHFRQEKMWNSGSNSKIDYNQLAIVPNVEYQEKNSEHFQLKFRRKC
jgi:hypothetical protein